MDTAKQGPAENSPLSEEELAHFRNKLLKEKEVTKKKIQQLEENLETLNKNVDDEKSARDHHHGDLATDEDTKLTYLSALEKNQNKLDKITVALDRISTGNYGICIETGQPIQKERLEAIPYALRSVGVKE